MPNRHTSRRSHSRRASGYRRKGQAFCRERRGLPACCRRRWFQRSACSRSCRRHHRRRYCLNCRRLNSRRLDCRRCLFSEYSHLSQSWYCTPYSRCHPYSRPHWWWPQLCRAPQCRPYDCLRLIRRRLHCRFRRQPSPYR